MADPNQQFTNDHLLRIFDRGFRSTPSTYRDYDAMVGRTPLETMIGESSGLDLLRQYLPGKVDDTKAGKWLVEQLAAGAKPDSLRSKALEGARNLPLGGYSAERQAKRVDARATDPEVMMNTVMRGMVPDVSGTGEVPVGDSLRASAAQSAGALAGDIATDGLRNIWWFINAPQALTTLATLQASHTAGRESLPAGWEGPAMRSRTMRLATALPAAIGMSFAIGNYGRTPGYTAAVPSEADKTVAADPLAELGARYVLGRTGSLLPYDQFAKERPDVSKGEYEAYKAYLHGSSFPIKATLEGVNGPEVTFMGKSIPVATGVLPAIAAAIGTGFGVSKATRRLKAQGDLQKAKIADDRMTEALRDQGRQSVQYEQAYKEYKTIQDKNEGEILKQSLIYGGGSLTAAALAGQTLESLRRAMKGPAPAEPEVNA